MSWRNPTGNNGHARGNSQTRKASHDRNAIHGAIDGYVASWQPCNLSDPSYALKSRREAHATESSEAHATESREAHATET